MYISLVQQPCIAECFRQSASLDGRGPTWGGAACGAQLLHTHGIRVPLCEAYVVGGGNMFPGIVSSPSVGDVNAQWALGTLAAQGVRVVSADVGGAVYRRLRWGAT